MVIYVVCAWCGRVMGVKEAESATLPVSHSICCNCKRKLAEETDAIIDQQKTIHHKKGATP